MALEPTTGIEPVNLFLTKEVLYLLSYVGSFGAGNGTRTRNPQLGRLTLWPLSYSRFLRKMVERGGFEPPKASPTDLQSVPFGRSGTSPTLNLHRFLFEHFLPVRKRLENQ